MKDQILQALEEIERREDVRILLAVESAGRGDLHLRIVIMMCGSSMCAAWSIICAWKDGGM